MLVSKTDNIPTKKIISILGNISINRVEWWGHDETKAMEKLIEKAKSMGANAIINFSYNDSGVFGAYGNSNGIAVITENIDKKDSKEITSTDYKFCHKCGEKIPNSYDFCGKCGNHQ